MGCCTSRKPITPEQRTRITAILDYWYGPGVDRNYFDKAWIGRWFGFTEEGDREIRENFLSDYENYVNGEYSGWPYDKDGRLAAIIICD